MAKILIATALVALTFEGVRYEKGASFEVSSDLSSEIEKLKNRGHVDVEGLNFDKRITDRTDVLKELESANATISALRKSAEEVKAESEKVGQLVTELQTFLGVDSVELVLEKVRTLADNTLFTTCKVVNRGGKLFADLPEGAAFESGQDILVRLPEAK